jgi:hypothetical protein
MLSIVAYFLSRFGLELICVDVAAAVSILGMIWWFWWYKPEKNNN